MLVRDLIATLSTLPPDLEVIISSDEETVQVPVKAQVEAVCEEDEHGNGKDIVRLYTRTSDDDEAPPKDNERFFHPQLGLCEVIREEGDEGPEGDDIDEGGGDPTTAELLKPRGNGGVVSVDICFTSLSLVDGHATDEAEVTAWSQEQRDRAYDWAIRCHLQASDNDDVFVPPRPEFIRSAPNREPRIAP